MRFSRCQRRRSDAFEVYFSVESTKDDILSAFAVVFELILLYFLFNKLVICFICRILEFRSVTPVYPLRIRSHLNVSGPHAFASYIRARQRDFPRLYRQSRQRRPAPNRRIRQGVAPFPSAASLEACEPRTSNGRVLVRRMGQRFRPIDGLRASASASATPPPGSLRDEYAPLRRPRSMRATQRDTPGEVEDF